MLSATLLLSAVQSTHAEDVKKDFDFDTLKRDHSGDQLEL